jgi:periplasmic divalent cation tolerance protein
MDLIVVLCTVPDAGTGARLARAVVEEQLAACVNVVPALRSIYSYEDEIQDDEESLLVIKARRSRFEELRARLVELHPYDVPEVLGIDAVECHRAYLEWALSVTR